MQKFGKNWGGGATIPGFAVHDGFHGDKATILYLTLKYYSLSVLSEKLYFLEIDPVNQKLWPFKCMMLKTLNSNFLLRLQIMVKMSANEPIDWYKKIYFSREMKVNRNL